MNSKGKTDIKQCQRQRIFIKHDREYHKGITTHQHFVMLCIIHNEAQIRCVYGFVTVGINEENLPQS